MSIVIIKGKRNLRSFLRQSVNIGKTQKFIILDGNEADRALLQKRKISEIAPERLDVSLREDFLKEYINLIGMVSRECNSMAWWATDIASKNRATSRLPFLLYEYLFITESISKVSGYDLLVVNPSWVVIDSLKGYLAERKIKYQCFLDSFGKWRDIALTRVKAIRLVLYIFLRVNSRKIYFRFKLKNKIKELSSGGKYYVIKTFAYNHSFDKDGNYKDAFFGSLPDFLKEKKKVLICAVISGRDRLCVEGMRKCKTYLILPVEIFLSLRDTFMAATKVLFTRIRIKKGFLFLGLDVSGILNEELKRTYNGISFYQFLHYWMTWGFLKNIRIETFLLTYENNPWEKMCIMALREFSPDTIVIGYQHTIVPQASANAFNSRKEQDIIPVPDCILTVGEVPKCIMERYGNYEKGLIQSACGLRFEYLANIKSLEKQKSNRLLVALEGIPETYNLVNYIIKELASKNQFQIRLRTHPVFPVKRFEHMLTNRLDQIENFTISDGSSSLKDDIEWADAVIYWGSTVAIEALCLGRPIIRYDMDPILSYDPLFECGHLKWIVNDDISLLNTLEEIYSFDDEHFKEEQKNAKEYLEHYFFPVTRKNMEKFLSAAKRKEDLNEIP